MIMTPTIPSSLQGNGLFNTATGKLSYFATCTANAKIGKEVKGEGSTPLKLGEQAAKPWTCIVCARNRNTARLP